MKKINDVRNIMVAHYYKYISWYTVDADVNFMGYPLVGLTIEEVIERQEKIKEDQTINPKWDNVGIYLLTKDQLQDAINFGVVHKEDIFCEEVQDKIFKNLMIKCDIVRWDIGLFDDERFLKNIISEFNLFRDLYDDTLYGVSEHELNKTLEQLKEIRNG